MKKPLSILFVIIIVLGVTLFPTTAGATTSYSRAGIVDISNGWLNVRSDASSSSSIVTSLKKGSYVTLVSQKGSWWYIYYNSGKYGYCHADYISEVSCKTATVSISSGILNVRSGAGSSYSRIGGLENKKSVIVLSTSNGWSKILYNGSKVGYVSSQYLKTNSEVISLKVPSFKQYDSRWANVKLGSSGKTIRDIGCATTAISMMESYRTGTTIYPNAMSKKLKYTSSGSVYWPSNYKTVTDSTAYLKKIYDLLKSGKPVLFGAKNSYGGQHWVVITGYNGTSKLSASYFTINDPGSSTRKTLQQLLNSYPKFYKFLYY